MKLESPLGDKFVDRRDDPRPIRSIVVAGDDSSVAKLWKPVPECLAIQFAVVGVAVDIDEVEGIVAEQWECLVESHAQDRVPLPVRAEPNNGLSILVQAMPAITRPHVDAVEMANLIAFEKFFGRVPPRDDGDRELRALLTA